MKLQTFLSMLVLVLVIIVNVFFRCYDKTEYDKTELIKTLVRQTARWSVAAVQDRSPIVALLHANYGVGYFWALKDIATEKEIEAATNISILDFQKKILDIQDAATKQVSGACPGFASGLDAELLKLAGDAS